ncbi:PQQ-binding-like beta-propeller repeat protein [Dictyobacter formicarum]|uniref:Pyrrolo-quinoline quinone repeat domain-containing protein n=1 Tax=Dictyobacter formicarum TaxID=2778368 RepID=A0ABQ3VBG4_9CHLR|nr:PQQ-binding-like beta-propeller repeat protein [Dictyobacter formicarum]GHO83495.1 hypothetical protein KSZ_15010 [Dictyobacter formicarum]
MGYDERKDLFDDEFKIVDLDSLDSSRGGLLHGRYFSGRSRFFLTILTLLGAVVLVLALLWPNIMALSQSLISSPTARATTPVTHIVDRTPPMVTIATWGSITVMRGAPGYNADQGRLFAFETRTGHVLWRSNQDIRTFGVADAMVYVQWSDYSLHVLNVRDGSQIWQQKLVSGAAITSEANGLLFVAPDSATVMAYRLNDGTLVWSHQGVGSLLQVEAGLAYTFTNGPASSGIISAFHVSDGSLARRYPVADSAPRAIIIEQGVIYTLQNNLLLVAVRVADQQRLWQRQMERNADLARIADGQIYLNVYDGQGRDNWIDVWSATDGSSLWSYHYGFVAFSDEQNGIVYASAHSSISALRASDGSLLWHRETKFLDPDIQINDGTVYISSFSDGIFNALNASSGQMRWSYSIAYNGDVQLDVLGFIAHIEHGIVYIVSMNDFSIKAMRASDKALLWSSHISLIHQ